MSQLLHIDCSIRNEGSYSRRLSRKFVDRWHALHPDERLVYRDLAAAQERPERLVTSW
jgi:FMN-dependent NADH-azoreductase